MSGPPATLHASAVLIGGHGVLIRGRSGSGKSSLVLALLAADPQETRLIADDRVIVTADEGSVTAAVPEAIAGMLEVRGVGIVRRPFVSPAAIAMIVDLCPPQDCPRWPEAGQAEVAIGGVVLPRIMLPEGLADAALRVRAALDHRVMHRSTRDT